MNTPIQTLDTSFRGLLRVALPMSLGALVQFIVVFTDNYFVSRISGEAMSAVSYCGLIYVTLAMIGYGLGNASQIIIARRKGEGNDREVASTAANALWLSLITAAIQFVLLAVAVPAILPSVIASDTIRTHMEEFIPWRAAGYFFYTPLTLLLSFWSGIAVTRAMAYTTLITAVVNIGLDYLLVFGHYGAPEMGVAGAALATTIAEACALLYLVIYTVTHPASRPFALFSAFRAMIWKHTAAIVKLGGPIILQLVLSLFIWLVFYNFVEKLGETSTQSAFIVRNMYMLAWVSVMGVSTTTKTYVSGLIAEGRQSDLVPTIRKLILMNLTGIGLLTHGLILYPEFIAGLFTENAETIQLTVRSAWVVFPAVLVFGCTSILLGTVEGSGNTMAGFVIELITTLFYLAAAYFFAIERRDPVYIVWTADYVYFVLIGVLSLLYLRNGKWKSTEV